MINSLEVYMREKIVVAGYIRNSINTIEEYLRDDGVFVRGNNEAQIADRSFNGQESEITPRAKSEIKNLCRLLEKKNTPYRRRTTPRLLATLLSDAHYAATKMEENIEAEAA